VGERIPSCVGVAVRRGDQRRAQLGQLRGALDVGEVERDHADPGAEDRSGRVGLLRGVVHGVHSTYPIMLDQGFGHIINTASLAGLVPSPLKIAYTATKHAVVGLSLGLRSEGADQGVRVSVICPGYVDTPLLDNVNRGLPQTAHGAHARERAIQLQGRPYLADQLARDVLRGIDRNQAVIVAPSYARVSWWIARFAPSLALRSAGENFRQMRSVPEAPPARNG